MADDYKAVRAAVRASHERLVPIVQGLSEADLSAGSYCAEWSTAQLLSHLGSGAEIGLALFDAALSGSEMPGREIFQPIWDKWNARSPKEVQQEVLGADGAQIEAFETADDAVLGGLQVALFGRDLDAAGLFAMRLGEHALHTWDLEVEIDPAAVVPASAVEILIDRQMANLGRFASGARPAHHGAIDFVVSAPARRYCVDLSGESVALCSSSSPGEGRIEMPSESLLRLLYGRLDGAHTPESVTVAGPVTLEELRVLFPGF